MDWWLLIGVAVVVALGFLADHLGWIDLSNKSRQSGSGASLIGMGDEVFAPSRYEAAIEIERQTVLPAPAPLAGDGDKGVYDGRIRLEV